jgi:hypothetical protein
MNSPLELPSKSSVLPIQGRNYRQSSTGWTWGSSVAPVPITGLTRVAREQPVGHVGVLYWQTYQGGTWGSRLWWGSPDLKLKGMRKDMGYKIYTGSGCPGGEPYVLFRVSSMVPSAWCWLRCWASYPALLYIVQGPGS